MKIYRVITLLLAFTLALSACNLPSANATPTVNANAVFTAAAQTVTVKLTENAAATPSATLPPPSNTPQPAASDTPLPPVVITATSAPVVQPTAACNAAQFVSDVTIPDGTGFAGGATFTKTWRLKNAGTCSWTSSFALSFDSGTQMGGPSSQPIGSAVAPGATVDISVNLQAPNADGNYTGVWGIINGSGVRIPVYGGIAGKSFTVVIKVGSGSSSASATPGGPTLTPDPGAKFAVTSVVFHNTCSSGKFNFTVDITVNKAGTVKYTWKNSNGDPDAGSPHSLDFSGPGTQSLPKDWTNSGTVWIGVYIDSPNHQNFQGPSFTCP